MPDQKRYDVLVVVPWAWIVCCIYNKEKNIEDAIEPFLIQRAMRTPRGRTATQHAYPFWLKIPERLLINECEPV